MKLSECCTIIAGQSPESKYYNTDRIGLPFFQGKADFGDLYPTIRVYCNQPIRIAEKDDILLSVRAPVGPTNLALDRVCIGRGLTAIRPKDGLLAKYLLYYFKFFEGQLQAKGTGTTFKAITQDVVKNLEIEIPPVEEQLRIVARIEELFSQLDDAEATLQKTKAQLALYRQAVYASAYKGMTADHSIVEYFEIAGGITKNATRSSLRLKRPYLRVANVYYNRLDLSDIKEIGITKAEVEKCTLAKNDLLFVEGNGSQSQISRVAIWDGSIPDIVHQNHIIKGRPNGSMLPEFALFYLISAEGRKQITEVAKSTSGLYTLSTDKVRKLKIPYCSIEAQRDIIDEIDERLSMCDSIEETILKVLTQITATKQAILKQAFQNRGDKHEGILKILYCIP